MEVRRKGQCSRSNKTCQRIIARNNRFAASTVAVAVAVAVAAIHPYRIIRWQARHSAPGIACLCCSEQQNLCGPRELFCISQLPLLHCAKISSAPAVRG
eukprot:6188607-Pleurochrysis_carterae.AAC.2